MVAVDVGPAEGCSELIIKNHFQTKCFIIEAFDLV